MKRNSKKYTISIICRLLKISRQGYYEFLHRKPSKRELHHEYLIKEIKRIYKEHKGRYGSPRIALQMYMEGIETNKKTIAKLMQKEGLVSIYYKKRKYKKVEKELRDYIRENILERQFKQEKTDKVLVSDITYVPCRDGTLYLTSYIDLSCRMLRSYKISTHMRKSVVIEPLINILKKKNMLGCIIHTDRGSQYRSYEYKELLEKNQINHSMSKPGTPLDNAVIESFYKTVKVELINPNKNKTKAEMKVLLRNYLEDYYPKKRIHTSLGMTPYKYEQILLSNS